MTSNYGSTKENLVKLEDVISEMRIVAENLTPVTYPKVSLQHKSDAESLKQRHIVIDGYDLIVHFNRANYDTCYVETLEIGGVHIPFLPMYLVCKLGASFLGNHELKYSEAFKNGRKIYLWTIAVDKRGCPITLDTKRLKVGKYENFEYLYLPGELLRINE
jgi:hypothetical protein